MKLTPTIIVSIAASVVLLIGIVAFALNQPKTNSPTTNSDSAVARQPENKAQTTVDNNPKSEIRSEPKPIQPTNPKPMTPNPTSATAITMPNGLIIDDTVTGTGDAVKSGDMITIHYTGKLTDGTVFDSSIPRNEPFQTQIGVGRVIQGWDEGLIGMKVGGKRTLTIPSELGYGARGAGASIPPNSILIFELELLDTKSGN